MSTRPRRVFTGRHWRSRRSAAVAGVLFAVLLVTAILTMRAATEHTDVLTITADPQQRRLVATSLQIVPFAGIAFLWFIGVVRDQLGDVEDRLFSTVFLGSGLLFLATLFQGAATQTSVLAMLAADPPGADVWSFARGSTQTLVSVYAMRMAAVFTFSVSSLALRTRAVPGWVAVLGLGVGLLLMLAGGTSRWVQLAFPSWVLVLSLTILVTRPAGRPAPPSDAAADGAAPPGT